MNLKSRSIFVTLFFLLTNFVFAQDEMTLSDCLFMAYKNNLSLKEVSINEKIATLKHTTDYLKLAPTLNANASNRYSWGRGIDPNTNSFIDTKFKSYSGNISSNLNLFSGFLNINTIKQSKQEFEINKALYDKLKNEITIEIASKFITVLYTEEIIKAIKEQLTSSAKQLELIVLKFNAGYVSQSEVFKVKSEIANQELNLLTTQNVLLATYTDLKSLLNMPLDDDLRLNPLVNENARMINLEQKEMDIVSKSLDKNPTFLLSKLQVQKAKTAIAIRRAAVWPSLRANFGYGSSYSDSTLDFNFEEQLNINRNYGLAFNLSIPIFNQFDSRSKIKESKLFFEQATIKSSIEKNTVSNLVLKALNNAKASKKKYEAAQTSLDFAQKTFEAESLKYNLGKITINDLSFTKDNFFTAQANFIQSKYEFLFSNALIKFYLGENFSL